MQLHHEFVVRTPLDTTFRALTNLEFIAPSMPGARLDGRDGEDYVGVVRVKVGPITTEFAGSARFLECDHHAHRAAILAKGRDTKAAGMADAVVRAHLASEGDGTRVVIDTELNVSGKIAQFGRSAMADISTKLIDQFAADLDERLSDLDRSTRDGERGSHTVPSAPHLASAQVDPVDVAALVGLRQRAIRWIGTAAAVAFMAVIILRRRH